MQTNSTNDWGTATFDNRAALDWVEGFVADPRVETIRAALLIAPVDPEDGVPSLVGRADVDDGHRALAAAEVVAAWSGRPAVDLPVQLTPWLMGRSQVLPGDLVQQAHEAVLAIGERSALRELWRERGRLPAWESEIAALVGRLGARPADAVE